MTPDDTLPPSRRSEDPRISKLVQDVADLKSGLEENNKTTHEVRDILTSFRVVGQFAKWLSMIGAGIVAVWHGWQTITGR